MNLKGGTAKTVTAINMAAILARDYQKRVLLIDADSQANLTEFMMAGLPEKERKTNGGLYDVLTGKRPTIRTTLLPLTCILPATDDLMDLDVSKIAGKGADVMALAELAASCSDADLTDHIIIDCPPAFSTAAAAALIAADDVVIPMKLDAFGIRGMTNLLRQVKNMQRINPALKVAGILPTIYYKAPMQDEAEQLLKDSGLPVFSHIRRSTKVDDMTFAQMPITKSSPRSSACHDYRRFVEEFLKGGVLRGV